MRRSGGPAIGVADRREGIAMKRRGAMLAQGFEVIGSGVALMAREAVLRVHGVPLFHASVAMRFGKDGSGGDGNAARVAFDERFLLDENV